MLTTKQTTLPPSNLIWCYTGFLTLILIFSHSEAITQNRTLSGKIIDQTTDKPLPGAQVFIMNSSTGAYTGEDGAFSLKAPFAPPFELRVTFIGYDTLIHEVTRIHEPLELYLTQTDLKMYEVEILAEGGSDLKNRVALSIETLNLKAIRNSSEVSFYDELAVLREVDMLTVSFGFKVINTRGFNSSTPVRSLQLIDGIDNASPGLNYPLGNFVGLSELDVEGVDLVLGASSCYFGPGAFNGVVSMRTRSPYVHQGLEVMLKAGERQYRGAAIRYAKAFGGDKGNPKWAFKLNASYESIYDWEANDRSPSRGSLNDSIFADNPGGYDAVNRYGDEISGNYTSLFEQFRHPGLGRFYRRGYWEKDLVDYDSYNVKLSGALHFRPREDIEIRASSSYGTGTTVMQLDNRLSLNGVYVIQNRLEIAQQDRFFLRFYNTQENAGDTYDIVTTAFLIQERWRGNSSWLTGYKNYWFRNINPRVKNLEGFPEIGPAPDFFYDFEKAHEILAANQDSLDVWHEITRNAQSGNFIEPGSPEFEEAFNDITRTPVSEGGTQYIDESQLYHIHGEYHLQTDFFDDITLGANYRWYRPYSEGTIFSDTSGTIIKNYEFGAYVGLEKRMLDDRFKINAAARLDKTKNYNYLVSPAFSATYRIDTRHQIRGSVSSALRNPTLIEQYYYFRVGNAILLGNLNGYENLITADSFEDYITSPNLDTTLLERFSEPPLVPEKAFSGEISYDGVYLNNHMVVNATYYLNHYRDFIGYKLGLRVPFFQGFPGTPRIFRFSANARDVTLTTGFSTGISYYFSNKLVFNGNYSWNRIIQVKDDPLIPAFNTPEHKFNLRFSGNDVTVLGVPHWNWGFTFRWVGGYTFESSPQFTGRIPAQYFLNAQITKTFPKLRSLVKVGGSNLLNRTQNGLYGGPNVGRFVYVAWGLRLME